MTPILPSESEMNRWCGEPVEMIIIPADCFKQINNNNQIILKDRYRYICQQMFHCTQAHFAIRCNQDDAFMTDYANCLRNVLMLNQQNAPSHS